MKKTVLVIEDEISLLDAISETLEQKGFEVVSARSAREVFDLLESLPGLAAVWLDHYIIGDKNGIDVVAHMKGGDRWKNIPIFVVSNTATDKKITSYIELGVDKFYVKSEVRIHDVVDQIARAISEA